MHSQNLKKFGPLIAVFLGFLIASVILLITGRNPISMFQALFRAVGFTSTGFNTFFFGEFLVIASIITLTGLSVGFAFRAGLFNIGAEGQLMMGSLGAFVVALSYPETWPTVLHMPAAVLAAALFGALWGAIPGALKAFFKVHEVVVTIMLNYIAFNLNNMVVRMPFFAGSHLQITRPIPDTALLHSDFLAGLTTYHGNVSRLNQGLYIMIFCTIIYWFVIEKTSFGYRIKTIGNNSNAARYAGMRVKSGMISSMAISGALAGLAGAILVLGVFGAGRGLAAMEMYGFDGIAVALVGGGSALGIFISGLLFAVLKVAQPMMQVNGIPQEIATIIAATIVFFIAIQSDVFKRIMTQFPSVKGDARKGGK